MNKYQKLRKLTGLSQRKFGEKYDIPYRTLQDWEHGLRQPPEWAWKLLEFKVIYDLGIK